MNATVYRDAWGVPHLRAGDPLALVRLQGRNVAEDRGWQIELQRRRSQGTTAAFLGTSALGWDRFARQARLDDTAQRCFSTLDPQTRTWLSAYVDGVNGGLHRGAQRAPEFAATGLAPGYWDPWAPLGIWMAVHILFAGFPAKLWNEQVARRLGDEAVDLFSIEGPRTSGSNGWLIDSGRTVTGAPIVAGDPHRFIENPGIYQQIRLACPAYDVIGMAVPGIPGIGHFGHTGGVAWAITNAMADYQDLYRERLRRRGPEVEAFGPDGWQPATAHTELIEVADAEPVEVEVIETARGPVVIGGPEADEALSLRYPPRVTGRLGFEALPSLLAATTVADVDAAFDQWAEPVNVVMAADTQGGLLHRVAGVVPRRHRDNLLRVVPAWDSDHAWHGWHSMPSETVQDFAVMANHRGIAEPFSTEFAAPHRAHRIRELLAGRDKWSIEDMPIIHNDTFLGSAAPLLDLLAGLEGLSPQASKLRDRLADWDRRMDAESKDSAAYAAVRSCLVRRLAQQPALAGLATELNCPEFFQPWVEPLPLIAYALENLLDTDLLPGLDLVGATRAALEDALGKEVVWGELHRLAPLHALGDPLFPTDDEPVDLAVSGDHNCVRSTSSVPGLSDLCVRGSAMRFAWDLARREDSLWIVPLGACGVAGDPHHHDQLPLWLRGELAPIVTDWSKLTPEEPS